MKKHVLTIAIMLVVGMVAGSALLHASKAPKPVSDKKFAKLADAAIAAMKQKAAELKITGVAVVCYAPGESVLNWSSKMAVVGRMKDPQTATAKGNNLIAIAYSKASEMADTLEDSGTAKRPPMVGEFGYQGGAFVRVKGGIIIVAFSGGRSEDDYQISRAGLEVLKAGL